MSTTHMYLVVFAQFEHAILTEQLAGQSVATPLVHGVEVLADIGLAARVYATSPYIGRQIFLLWCCKLLE